MTPSARFAATPKAVMTPQTAIQRQRVTMMSANHGLSKGDKKQLRKQNSYLFEQGKGQHLTHSDIENPSLRHTIESSQYGHSLSKKQINEIMDAAQTHQFKAVERLAHKYGVTKDEALHFADVAKLETNLAKYQKMEHKAYQDKKMRAEMWNDMIDSEILNKNIPGGKPNRRMKFGW